MPRTPRPTSVKHTALMPTSLKNTSMHVPPKWKRMQALRHMLQEGEAHASPGRRRGDTVHFTARLVERQMSQTRCGSCGLQLCRTSTDTVPAYTMQPYGTMGPYTHSPHFCTWTLVHSIHISIREPQDATTTCSPLPASARSRQISGHESSFFRGRELPEACEEDLGRHAKRRWKAWDLFGHYVT